MGRIARALWAGLKASARNNIDFSAMTQKQQIMWFLKHNGSMTPMDAWDFFGNTHLSQRIGEMEKDDDKLNIGRKMVKGRNKFGKKCEYMTYTLKARKK